jgi:hypothetical protein
VKPGIGLCLDGALPFGNRVCVGHEVVRMGLALAITAGPGSVPERPSVRLRLVRRARKV